jgi:benzoyl-CoA reductase subunit B
VLTNACNTYIKWAEIWERFYHADTFTLDIPATRTRGGQTWPGDPGFESDLRYVKHQLGELIELCERITGVKFDIDRLREALDHSNAMSRAFAKVIKLNKRRPAPFNALMDGTVYLGIMNAWRGTLEGRAYFEDLLEELEYAADQGIGTLKQEDYPLFRRFNEMFAEHGGTFVNSTYLWFASGGANLDYEYDLDRPLESLAEGTLITVRDAMDSMFWPSDTLEQVLGDYEVDGVVFHPIKSCRTVSTGLADTRRDVMQRHDIPTLFVESDQMDRRVVSEAQMKNRIDAFFENLATRRKLSAARPPAGDIRGAR